MPKMMIANSGDDSAVSNDASSSDDLPSGEEQLVGTSDTELLVPPPALPKTPKFKLVLEVGVFLNFLAISMAGAVFQNQLLYQSCIVVFQYNETTCAPLKGTTEKTAESERIESDVQVYVSKIIMASSVITSVVPAILSLFIGPWSDKFGRRPIVRTIAIAYFLDFVMLTVLGVLSLTNEFSPWLYLLPCLPAVLCGGTCALTTVIYSYISDVSEGKTREIRMLIIQAFVGFGMIFGSLGGGYLLAATNFTTVYVVSTAIMLLAALYTLIFVPESLQPAQLKSGSRLRGFFHFALVAELFRTGFKARPKRGRAIIWLILSAMVVSKFVADGEANVAYFFLMKHFGWTLQDYNLYLTIAPVIFVAGGIIGVTVLRRVFGCTIPVINMISYAGATLQSLLRALALYTWQIYVGLVVGCMSGLPNSMSLALLSDVTPPAEIGKMFALSTALLTLLPLGAAPIYTLVYDTTLNSNPGVYNYVSFGLFIIAFLMMTTILRLQRAYKGAGSTEAPPRVATPT